MKSPGFRQLTWRPLRAIREKCLWCANGQAAEIEKCTARDCALHPFRSGTGKVADKTCFVAVRKKCLDCMTGSRVEVERCRSVDCPLWMFRLGGWAKRPVV